MPSVYRGERRQHKEAFAVRTQLCGVLSAMTAAESTAQWDGRMADRIDAAERSRIMSRVRSKDTRPEMIVRSLVHGMGYRYRLHRRDLPGSPDMVFPRLKKVIFVHGCFWHSHPGCKRSTRPTSRVDFWDKKLEANLRRDREAIAELERMGWRVLVIWECETRDEAAAVALLRDFMNRA
jgi:DNA mismatch endonuclease, patch repair protein